MKNDGNFVVRLPKEKLNEFNNVLKRKAINRSELFRQWIDEYLEDNKENESKI